MGEPYNIFKQGRTGDITLHFGDFKWETDHTGVLEVKLDTTKKNKKSKHTQVNTYQYNIGELCEQFNKLLDIPNIE